MIRRKISSAVLAFALILSLAPFGFTQLGNSGVNGTVTDPSCAVIAQAKVIVRNTATGQVRETRTDEFGIFKLQNLPPAAYQLMVEAQGFAPAIIRNITLRVGESPTIGVSMRVLGAAESVMVRLG